MKAPFLVRLGLATVAVFALVCGGRLARGDEPPPRPTTMTIDQIRRLIHDQRGKLVSLRVEFRSWHHKNLGTARYESYVVAASAGRRYAHLWHGEFSDPADDPRAGIQLLINGENWDVFIPYFRRFDVSRRFAVRPFTDKILFHPLFESLGWWPPGDTDPPARRGDRRFFVHDIVDDERCRVIGLEQVDGAWCQVVELPGTARLWVDGARAVVPRRIFQAASGNADEDALFEAGDYREVASGLFLPYRMRRFRQAGGLDFTTLVSRYSVNAVPDEQFRLEVPAGTLINDRDTDTFRQLPGGFEVMERLVDWEKSVIQPSVPSAPTTPRTTAIIGLAGMASGIAVSRMRKGRGRGAP